jgi:glycosyltransferase involved in cell wall biosynthesis
MIKISIIIPCHNEDRYLRKCIESMLSQSYKNWELIIIDDGSTDKSREIINSYKDERIIRIFNKQPLGPARARNLGIKRSIGEILFFTDADCYADENWLENGLDFFRKNRCLGVEGKLFYISKDYITSLSDQLTVDLETRGQWMTANVAYEKTAFDKAGLFNEQIKFQEDRALALRIKKYGEILYCRNMIITHMEKKWTPKGFINNGKRIESIIQLFLFYNDKIDIKLRIVRPINLLKIIIFPLAFIGPIIKNKVKTSYDWKLLPLVYIRLVLERITIWRTAIKERVFLI